jgi:copper chaperone CopZ
MFTISKSLMILVMFALVLGCQDNPRAVETREYAIEGMSCEGCAATITATLKAVPGVQSVQVSLQDKKATVVADSSQVSPQTIEDAVGKAGYKAHLIAAARPGK